MDIGALIVSYFFLSLGVYMAELQTIKRETREKKAQGKRFKARIKPSAKSVFARSVLSLVVLILVNEGFLHWKDIPFFTIATIIGFFTYDFVLLLEDPVEFLSLVPLIGDKLTKMNREAKKLKENEKEEEKKSLGPPKEGPPT